MANATSASMQDLPRTEIKQTEFGEALFTVDAVPAGTVILSFDLDPVHVHPSPTRFSVQVDKDKHLDTPGALFQWLQHQEEPSLRADTGEKLNFIAVRDMEAGELLSFNYNTTEYDMASPFECWETGSIVRGYAHLSAAERAAIAKYAAPHVLRLAEQENDALNVAAA